MKTILLTAVLLVSIPTFADSPPQPGTMLREGTWNGDVGSYSVPESLAKLKPAQWPKDGWQRIEIRARDIVVSAAPAGGASPAFLKSIVRQLEAPETAQPPITGEVPDVLYLRVPGVAFASGRLTAYRFRNGTLTLRPVLDRRYELEFAGKPFAFRVQNGLRGRNGERYGDGAQYAIEYGGHTYEYSLGEFGWDSTINAIADLDGDGWPDFIVSVAGNNSGYQAVLLSSRAQPGRNAPTASLVQNGC